jgi:hypothetical protein
VFASSIRLPEGACAARAGLSRGIAATSRRSGLVPRWPASRLQAVFGIKAVAKEPHQHRRAAWRPGQEDIHALARVAALRQVDDAARIGRWCGLRR